MPFFLVLVFSLEDRDWHKGEIDGSMSDGCFYGSGLMKQNHDQSINTIKRSIPDIHSSKKKQHVTRNTLGSPYRKCQIVYVRILPLPCFLVEVQRCTFLALTTLSSEYPKDPLADATCTPKGGSPHPQDHPVDIYPRFHTCVATKSRSEIPWNSGWVK